MVETISMFVYVFLFFFVFVSVCLWHIQFIVYLCLFFRASVVLDIDSNR